MHALMQLSFIHALRFCRRLMSDASRWTLLCNDCERTGAVACRKWGASSMETWICAH